MKYKWPSTPKAPKIGVILRKMHVWNIYLFACLLNFLLLVWNGFYYTLTGMRKKKRVINSVGQECKKSKTPNEIHLKYSTQWKQMQNKRNGQRCCHNIFRKLYRWHIPGSRIPAPCWFWLLSSRCRTDLLSDSPAWSWCDWQVDFCCSCVCCHYSSRRSTER